MAPLPSFPTDSLYKFVALFGLVLFAFAAWYPEQKFREADAAMREERKTQDLSRIRIERKKAQVDRLSEAFLAKSDKLKEQEKILAETRDALNAKNRAMSEDLNRLEKRGTKAEAEQMLARSKALTLEVNALSAKTDDLAESVQKLTADRDALVPRQDEVIDDLKSEIVVTKNHTEALNSLAAQARNWLIMQYGGALLGVFLIFLGFATWYFRVQRYQDSILRKQVGDQ
jgi:uncharacterized coiled-coil DUF342 family protein